MSSLLHTLGGMILGGAMAFVYLKSAEHTKKEAEEEGKKPSSSSASSLSTTKTRSAAESPKIDRSTLTVSKIEREGLLTGILAQLWDHINVAGCQIIRESVEPSFAESLPTPFNSLRFTKLDLGKTPLRLDNIVVHERENGVVQFDVDVVWDGDCEIQLKADYVGSLGVKTIKLHGRMAFVLKPLTNVLPIASAVQYFFIDPPVLRLDFTGLAQVADMKMINRKILKIIDDILAGMLVLPNRMTTKLDPAVSFYDVYQPPRGMIRLSVLRGKGFVSEKRRLRSEDIPDVYCKVALGTAAPYKTSTCQNSLEPTWTNESCDFLLSDYRQTVTVQVFDEDRGAVDADDELGTARVAVQQLMLAAGNRSMAVPLQTEDGTTTGATVTLRCDLLPLTSQSLTSLTTQKKSPTTMGGLLTILVSHATGIPAESSKAGTFCKVTYGENHEFVTAAVMEVPGVDAINPAYDGAFHIPLSTQAFLAARPDVLVQVLQTTEDANKPKLLGQTSVTHSELSRAPETRLQTKRDVGGGITVNFCVSLQGLLLEGAAVVGEAEEEEEPVLVDPVPFSSPVAAGKQDNTAAVQVVGTEPAPSGTIRLTAVKGRGFKVEKRRMKRADIPDVYLTIHVGSSNKPWSTAVLKNCTEPEWNESAAFMIADNTDMIKIEAFDKDSGSHDADDELGTAQITVGKLVLSGGSMELELEEDGETNGAFVTLRCEKVG